MIRANPQNREDGFVIMVIDHQIKPQKGPILFITRCWSLLGHRSVHRDLETNLFVTTTSPSLRREMAEEEDVLYKQAALVTLDTFNREDRIVPLWVKLVTLFFKYFF